MVRHGIQSRILDGQVVWLERYANATDHECKLLLYLGMKRLLTFVFLLILCVFAKGQQEMVWLSTDSLAVKGYYQNMGIAKDVFHVGIVAKNNTGFGKKVLLEINNPHINRLYLINKKGDTLVNTGDHALFNSRPLYHWDFVLPIEVDAFSSDSLKLVLDKKGESLSFFLEVLSESLFYKRQLLEALIMACSFSTSVILTLYFLSLSFLRKKRNYAILSVFILATLCWILNMNGILFQLFIPDNLFLHHISRTFYSSFSIGAFIFYFLHFYWNEINVYVRRIYLGFCGFLAMRFLVVLLFPALIRNAVAKSILLTTGTAFIIIGLLLIVLHLITFFRKKESILHNIGFGLYLVFVFNEGIKLTGVDMVTLPQWNMYTTVAWDWIIISVFSLASFLDYRREKRKQLYSEILSQRIRNQQISNMIVDAQEYERNIISKNIHDQLGGLLAVIKIKLETLKFKIQEQPINHEFDNVIKVLDNCNTELYSIVDELSSPEFEKTDLSEIIAYRLQIIKKSTNIILHYEPIQLELSGKTSLTIYRIICELITNAIKHAKCSDIYLEIFKNNKDLIIAFTDNGIGMGDIEDGMHRGIENIRSRVSFMNGTLHLESNPGKTFYQINIPMN